MSALPPIADILGVNIDVRFVPEADIAFGVIVEPTLLADFRAKSPRVTLDVTPK